MGYSGVTNAKQALEQSAQERRRKYALLDQAVNSIGPASLALQDFYGPGGMSDWKRTQTQARTSTTNQGFNNARANMRRRSLMSGFGYEQPATQAGENEIENARASALSAIPGQVEAESVPISLQAIGQQNQLAGTRADVGRSYNPEYYYGQAADLDEAEKQRQDRKRSLFGSILGGGLSIASKFIPGL